MSLLAGATIHYQFNSAETIQEEYAPDGRCGRYQSRGSPPEKYRRQHRKDQEHAVKQYLGVFKYVFVEDVDEFIATDDFSLFKRENTPRMFTSCFQILGGLFRLHVDADLSIFHSTVGSLSWP